MRWFRGDYLSAGLQRTLICAAFWWILTEGAPNSWLLGLPAAITGAVLSLHLTPPCVQPCRWWALPGFLLYFLRTSVVAGLDVARRTLSPSLPVHSCMTHIETPLRGIPLWLMMTCLSLLPGTLSVSIKGDTLRIHSLDLPERALPGVKELERQIERLLPCQDSPKQELS